MAEKQPKKKTILIVDDSAMNREMIHDILGDGYDYRYAEDGEKALELLSNNVQVDILLLDMNMPKMGGMDVLKAMNEHHWTDEIPVVIISADGDNGFIQNAYRLGAIDYIVRPFNAFLVQHRVENTLALYSQNKRLVKLVESQVFEREKTNNMLINIFSHVVEIGNNESGSHTLRVQRITNLLLNKLVKLTDQYTLSEADIAMISSVSALHDIGKIFIPKNILNKPGKLTDAEWKIMQSHTVQGDRFLSEIPIDQTEKLMITAHEICRYHHERYDGRGYPDGLRGEEIPISAQVVSLADVYDALTSDRCYKKAFTHQEAVNMILGGQCGVFSPLLRQCFTAVADELLLTRDFADHEYINDAQTLASEAMEREELHLNDRTSYLIDCERIKKEFFGELSGGIQFEYDAVTGKILCIDYYDDTGRKICLSTSTTYLLGDHDWEQLREQISRTTPNSPTVIMNVMVPINKDLRWYRLTVRTIWTKDSHTYIGVVGQFTDIHESIVEKEANLWVDGKFVSGQTLVEMRHIFDKVRLIDPADCQVLSVLENGSIAPSGLKCYEVWNREGRCSNCMWRETVQTKNWMSRLESRDGRIYSVLSRCAQYRGKDCVFMVALGVDEPHEQVRYDVGFVPDSVTLQIFYRDTLTKAYSRAYLEHFLANLEGADAVAMIDVDHFKEINDTYGHLVGDAALRHIVDVIRGCVRAQDVIIRYGGDEFLLVVQTISENDFFKMLKRIREAVSQSILQEYPEITLSISAGGVYGSHPLPRAIDAADKAMYRDKFQKKEMIKNEGVV